MPKYFIAFLIGLCTGVFGMAQENYSRAAGINSNGNGNSITTPVREGKLPSGVFPFFLQAPTMIVNSELDNTMEGHYIHVLAVKAMDSTIAIHLPMDKCQKLFPPAPLLKNSTQWMVGWGNEVPFYDAGVENLRGLQGAKWDKVGTDSCTLQLGSLLRGQGWPKVGQRIAIWNRQPSGFKNRTGKPLFAAELWAGFAGKSIHLGGFGFDSTLQAWVALVNECDTSHIQIYAAVSKDLIHWEAGNGGKPVLKATDFKGCTWAGRNEKGKQRQTAFISDLLYVKGKWYLFLDGYDQQGKRNIGLGISAKTILGPYTLQKDPILKAGNEGSWNAKGCFYGKVHAFKNGYLLFYDGVDGKDKENIGMAFSSDLVHWEQHLRHPVIEQHKGWRSSFNTSEPAFVDVRQDTIFLLCEGVKAMNSAMGKSGNVDDAQIGAYFSTDGGMTFIPHAMNPVYANDYGNPYENEHLGGNFKYLQYRGKEYIIYQAKSSFQGLKYNILLRER